MFELNDLFNVEKEEKYIEPEKIFVSLVKPEEVRSKYEYLRDVQTEALTQWFDNRTKKDTILKMNTGAGKTLVGLLILQSCINENLGLAVYVCPDLQLVDQVINKSKEYGIKCVQFETNIFPPEFLNGEAILVIVFDKLFNGKSIFNKYNIEIGAIVLDDAHSCINKAREKFTIKINQESDIYLEIYRLFQDELQKQDVGSAASISNGDRNTIMQIPFWTWIDNVDKIATILSKVAYDYPKTIKKDETTTNIFFNWPLLKNSLESCNVFISGENIEITPHCLPINQFNTFHNATRRIFMSATLLDDSALIKELDISREAIESPIINKKPYSIGERMILIPSLIEKSLNSNKLAILCKVIADSGKNVVVLTPSFSENYATKWSKQGGKVINSKNICDEIELLNESNNNYTILVNRYDGIDLHGDQCRLLVVHGLALGASLYEQFIHQARPKSKILKTLLAQKLEQGIGRSTRSSSDYSVVLLTGADLETFIGIKENKKYLSPQTRKQIDIGINFAKKIEVNEENAEPALIKLMDASFQRNSQWIKYHNTELQKSNYEEIQKLPIDIAIAERKAYDLYNSNRSSEACDEIERSINSLGDKIDETDKGWYLQLAAFYKYKCDKEAAFMKQIKAHELNDNLCKGIEGIKYKKLSKNIGLQPNIIFNNIHIYEESNAILIYITGILQKLTFGGNSNSFEEGCMLVGEFLGYNSQRPEKSFGRGFPDALWQMANNEYIIIEAKNEVKSKREVIFKSEAEQISNSYNWFLTQYAGKKGHPILIHPSYIKDKSAFPNKEVRVMTEVELNKFKKNILTLTKYVTENFDRPITVEDIGKQIILLKLTPETFISEYTRKIQ